MNWFTLEREGDAVGELVGWKREKEHKLQFVTNCHDRLKMDWTRVQRGKRTFYFYNTEKQQNTNMNVTLHAVQKATTHKQDPTI